MHGSNTRLGVWLFFVYSLLYAGFVLLAAFSPESMEVAPLAGVNLAIWFGFGLIFAALLLALVYGWACRPIDRRSADRSLGAGDRP
jgi:putative solute:sodium symporter small subunit